MIWLSRESIILSKNFLNESCRAWRGTWWKCGLDLQWPCQNQVKVTQSHYCFFGNGNPYFLLHILVAYLESFPKRYNKVTFHWVSELWSLKVTAGVIYVRMRVWAGFLRARFSAIYPHCLTYAHAYGIESNPSQLNDSTFLFSLYSFFFQFFFTLVGFFKVFFKMVAYSSNEIKVDIILVLGEAGQNYCRV